MIDRIIGAAIGACPCWYAGEDTMRQFIDGHDLISATCRNIDTSQIRNGHHTVTILDAWNRGNHLIRPSIEDKHRIRSGVSDEKKARFLVQAFIVKPVRLTAHLYISNRL